MSEEKSITTSAELPFEATMLSELTQELGGVAEADFIHINIDVLAAAATAIGIVPKLEKMRASLERLPDFDISMVNRLSSYAYALREAQSQYMVASLPVEIVPELVERATLLRDRLYADVQVQVLRDRINGDELKGVRTSVGHKALSVDLEQLTTVLKREWQDIAGSTSVTREEINEATVLGRELFKAVGEREQAPAILAEATAQRARAHVLFLRAYDEVRRAVTFLRWKQGDADLIAPSLYVGRGGPRKKEAAPTEPSTTPAVPQAPTNGSPIPVAGAGLGMPDSEPFTN